MSSFKCRALIVCCAAALALGARLGPQAIGALTPLLDDPQISIRDSAARALGRIGNADSKAALEEHLAKEQDPQVRENIQRSLTTLPP